MTERERERERERHTETEREREICNKGRREISNLLDHLQVCWQNNDMDGNMNFYSVSSDGRVVNWKLVKNELQCQDAVLLKIPGASVDGPEGTQQQALSESATK